MSREEILEYFNLHRIVTKELKVTKDAINKDPRVKALVMRLQDLEMNYQNFLNIVNVKGNQE